jgi:hypothetical protein
MYGQMFLEPRHCWMLAAGSSFGNPLSPRDQLLPWGRGNMYSKNYTQLAHFLCSPKIRHSWNRNINKNSDLGTRRIDRSSRIGDLATFERKEIMTNNPNQGGQQNQGDQKKPGQQQGGGQQKPGQQTQNPGQGGQQGGGQHQGGEHQGDRNR